MQICGNRTCEAIFERRRKEPHPTDTGNFAQRPAARAKRARQRAKTEAQSAGAQLALSPIDIAGLTRDPTQTSSWLSPGAKAIGTEAGRTAHQWEHDRPRNEWQ